MNERPITEDDLQAYVDERLEPPRQRSVEAYLAGNAEMQARIAALVAQRNALRAALAPIVAEPIPSRLDVWHFAPHRPRWNGWLRPLPALAASLALLCIGGLAGWQVRGGINPQENGIGALAKEAADSYTVFATDTLRPVEVSEPATLSHWVTSRLHRPVGVPDLTGAGFRLLGGRVVATPHGPAGLYIYERKQGARLGVLVRPMKIDRTTRMAEQSFGDLSGFTWADGGIGYSLVGAASASTLHPFADQIRQQSVGKTTSG